MNDELLVKFLLHEASSEEDRSVKNWLGEDEANHRKMEQLQLIWESSHTLALRHPVDSEEAWHRFKQLREQRKADQRKNLPLSTHQEIKRRSMIGWLQLAASVILASGILIGLYAYLIAPKHPYFSAIELSSTEVPRQETLPDGTQITLNKHSSVSYRESLFRNNRSVKMSGEVFFDVKSLPDHPFEIQVKDICVNVLGTSFNVKSNDKETEVIVESGSVQVSRHQVVIQLKPDEKAIARSQETGLVQKKQTDRLYDYYRSKVFKLDRTPLWRFVEVLNEVYQTHIVIEDSSVANLPISTTFENDSLTTILHTLCETLQVRTERNGGVITIKK